MQSPHTKTFATDWNSAPRPPPVPKVTLPRLPLQKGKGARAKGSKSATGGDDDGGEAAAQQQPAPPAATGTGSAAVDDGNGHGEA